MIPNNTPASVNYVGNDTASTFNFPFRVLKNSDLKVSVFDADLVETVLVLNTHYTYTAKSFPQLGGVVTLIAGVFDWITPPDPDPFNTLATGYTLKNQFVAAPDQIANIKDFGTQAPLKMEQQLDKLVMDCIAILEIANRALLLPEGGGSENIVLPPFAGNAGKLVKVNDDEDGLDYGPTFSEIETFKTDAEAAADAAEGFKDQAEGFKDQAEDFKDQAEIFKDDAAGSEAAALAYKNQTQVLRDETETIKGEAEDARDQAETFANEAESWADESEVSAMSALYPTVVELTTADSPVNITNADDGTLFKIDTTLGDVIVQLPDMQTVGPNFKIAVVKVDNSPSIITILRYLTDTINNGGSVVLSTVDLGVTVRADLPGTDWKAYFFILESLNSTNGNGGLSIDPTTQAITSGGQVTLQGSTKQQAIYVVGDSGNQDASPTPFLLNANHGDIIVIQGTDSTDYVRFPTSDVDYGLIMSADFYATKNANVTLFADMIKKRYYQIARTDMP